CHRFRREIEESNGENVVENRNLLTDLATDAAEVQTNRLDEAKENVDEDMNGLISKRNRLRTITRNMDAPGDRDKFLKCLTEYFEENGEYLNGPEYGNE
nr:hypothetical protein [Tanacetum cinerariifolium]